MIKNYSIHNFKNHADTSIELGHLSILTGANGVGKSSILQSMLLLRDSFEKNPQMGYLSLEGHSFQIGRSNELINASVKEHQDKLILALQSGSATFEFRYQYPLGNANELDAAKDALNYRRDDLMELPLFNDNFQYLSAFRNGPSDIYESNPSVVDKHRQISYRMGMGEYVAAYLSRYGHEAIAIPELKYKEDASLTLRLQVEAWMNEISNGIRFKIDEHGDSYEINYGYERPGQMTQYHSAFNTGYGVSYVLGIVVALLSAKPGSLILIENPEAHIHPSGQAALMRMISIAAEHGVQIILETHSDHIINGALVTYKKNEFNTDGLKIYFFDRDEDFNADPIPLKIGDDGIIKGAPVGFFDQMQMDLETLYDL